MIFLINLALQQLTRQLRRHIRDLTLHVIFSLLAFQHRVGFRLPADFRRFLPGFRDDLIVLLRWQVLSPLRTTT